MQGSSRFSPGTCLTYKRAASSPHNPDGDAEREREPRAPDCAYGIGGAADPCIAPGRMRGAGRGPGPGMAASAFPPETLRCSARDEPVPAGGPRPELRYRAPAASPYASGPGRALPAAPRPAGAAAGREAAATPPGWQPRRARRGESRVNIQQVPTVLCENRLHTDRM